MARRLSAAAARPLRAGPLAGSIVQNVLNSPLARPRALPTPTDRMPRSHPSPEQAGFIEEMSLFFDQTGLPRMAGRILAWLLICDPPAQTAGELGTALRASKGSISTMTRLLMNTGLVERTGLPGRRENFFRVRPGVWSELLGEQLMRVTAVRRLAERGLEVVAEPAGASRARLEEMRDLYAFMEAELPALLERWTAGREGHAPARLAG